VANAPGDRPRSATVEAALQVRPLLLPAACFLTSTFQRLTVPKRHLCRGAGCGLEKSCSAERVPTVKKNGRPRSLFRKLGGATGGACWKHVQLHKAIRYVILYAIT